MSEGNQQQQSQQQQSPTQRLERALVEIRKAQNIFEVSYPQQGDAIKLLREAGDLVWAEIQEKKQQMQQGQQS
jgi:hypothetical protein